MRSVLRLIRDGPLVEVQVGRAVQDLAFDVRELPAEAAHVAVQPPAGRANHTWTCPVPTAAS